MTEKKKEITERLCGLLFQPDNRTSPLHRPIHISLFQIAGFHGSKNIPIYIGISG